MESDRDTAAILVLAVVRAAEDVPVLVGAAAGLALMAVGQGAVGRGVAVVALGAAAVMAAATITDKQ